MSDLGIQYTTQSFPAGSGPIATITAVLTGAVNTTPQTVSIPLAATDVNVTLAPDTYSYTLTNADAAGNSYGGPFTGSIVIAAPATITLSLASGLTVISS